MSSGLRSSFRAIISQTGVGFFADGKVCYEQKSKARQVIATYSIYTVSVKASTASSLFPHAPTVSQTQQGTPGYAEARRDVRGGWWSFRVLRQTHSTNWGQWCPSMVAIMHTASIDSLLVEKALTFMLRTWSNLLKVIRFAIFTWRTKKCTKIPIDFCCSNQNVIDILFYPEHTKNPLKNRK